MNFIQIFLRIKHYKIYKINNRVFRNIKIQDIFHIMHFLVNNYLKNLEIKKY